MKLRNKKTGEIGKLHCDMNVNPAKYGVFEDTDIRGHYWEYNSLAELNEEWTDYEEPKQEWYINEINEPQQVGFGDPIDDIEHLREIGLLFETKEEAEKAVEKLKAWERLKEKGFRFNGYIREHKKGSADITIASHIDDDCGTTEDLYLLFSEVKNERRRKGTK